MPELIIIAHNLRSAHNVGSLLRTADGLALSEVILCGYTPFPALPSDDPRLPHEQRRVTAQIRKTALGAENTVRWRRAEDIIETIRDCKRRGYTVTALEQTAGSVPLPEYVMPEKLVIVLGREVEGLEPEVLSLTDLTLEIPMFGQKESFNVVQAAAMAMYHWRFIANS